MKKESTQLLMKNATSFMSELKAISRSIARWVAELSWGQFILLFMLGIFVGLSIYILKISKGTRKYHIYKEDLKRYRLMHDGPRRQTMD